MAQSISLGLIDQSSLFPKILRYFLSEQNNLNVRFQATDLPSLFEKLKSYAVDILLMNALVPQPDIVDVVKLIREKFSNVSIVVISLSTDLDLISELLDLGIHGYVSNADDPEDLLHAITVVSQGAIYRNKLFTEALYLNKQKELTSSKNGLTHLTERERKILKMLWEEKTSKEIADHFFLSVKSIEKIKQDMRDKLGIRSTVGLIKFAIKEKIIGNSFIPS